MKSSWIWAVWVVATSGHAVEQEFAWGAAYTEGQYGREFTTRIAQTTFAYSLRGMPWRFKVAANAIDVRGLREDASRYPIKHARGWSDANLSADYALSPAPRWRITLGGQTKIPLGHYADGLSTGKVDGGPQFGVYYAAISNITAYALTAYWWRGDPPGVALRNRDQFIAGIYWRINARFGAGVSADYTQRATDNSVSQKGIAMFAPLTLSERWGWVPYALAGFSAGSPRWGVGLECRYRIDLARVAP